MGLDGPQSPILENTKFIVPSGNGTTDYSACSLIIVLTELSCVEVHEMGSRQQQNIKLQVWNRICRCAGISQLSNCKMLEEGNNFVQDMCAS
jgi:hypothetical protein